MIDQRIVLLEILPKSKAWIERDVLTANPRQNRGFGPLPEFAFHEKHNVAGWRKGAPFFWTSAHVHQDHSAFYCSDGLGHLPVPAQTADVFYDLGPGRCVSARDGGLVRVD